MTEGPNKAKVKVILRSDDEGRLSSTFLSNEVHLVTLSVVHLELGKSV